MGILRTDVISHSQISNGNASVLFDGTTDSITIPSHSAFAFGTADYTVEMFVNFTALSGQQTLVGDTYGATNGFYFYKRSDHKLGWYYDNSNYWNANTLIEADRWYHLAFVRSGGTARIYIDGVLDGEDPTDTFDATVTQYYIGDTADSTSGEFFGYMSNLRITRTAVYKQNFTVPKFKLKEIPGTILLCCQSSSSTTEATVSVPGTLTANGDPTATAFGPGLKEDITDTGVVFDGVTTFDSQSYMVPPSGKTTERNRGRGIIGWGANPVSPAIDFINIQSQGIATRWGTLITTNWGAHGTSSSTRGLFAGGYINTPASTFFNEIEFLTIATEGKVFDFGNLSAQAYKVGALSNQTRAVFALGYVAPNFAKSNVIDFVTIATTGDASNFGDITPSTGRAAMAACSSTTRGLFAGGQAPSTSDIIDFITIASAGDATDFGNLTQARDNVAGASSNTRAVFGGGSSPTIRDTIDFVTIASTGDATDFGNLVSAQKSLAGTSDNTRGIFAGGYISPATVNVMNFVTIATTGNAQDFGDLTTARRDLAGFSDSHGGLA